MTAWWKPSKPGEIPDHPWLHPDVIAYLETIITPEMRVIEHGCGGSTLWLARRVRAVMSFEHSSAWRAEVEKRAPENVVILEVHHGIVPIVPYRFDLALIDGEPVADRALWLREMWRILRPGGWLVLDNANRPEYADEREALVEIAVPVKSFDRNDNTRYLVTDFWRMYA